LHIAIFQYRKLFVRRDKVKLDCSVTHSCSEDTEGVLESLAAGTENEEDRTDVSSYVTAGNQNLFFII
jgi:hypothetical protein